MNATTQALIDILRVYLFDKPIAKRTIKSTFTQKAKGFICADCSKYNSFIKYSRNLRFCSSCKLPIYSFISEKYWQSTYDTVTTKFDKSYHYLVAEMMLNTIECSYTYITNIVDNFKIIENLLNIDLPLVLLL